VVYNLKDAGYSAFATEVGFHKFFTRQSRANKVAAVNFEIYVDGKVAAQSGLVRPGDEPRLLVVRGLDDASELKLVVRRDNCKNDQYCLATWADPRFYKK
jgi:hypothetical protein